MQPVNGKKWDKNIPFTKALRTVQVSELEWLAVCYNERLNKVTQESEMDLVLRFWDSYKNKFQVRYWDLMFLRHATAAELLKKINDGLAGLVLSKQNPIVDGQTQHELKSSFRYEKRSRGSYFFKIFLGGCKEGVQIFKAMLPQNVKPNHLRVSNFCII